MAEIADVETWDGEGGELNWVRAGAWLRGRGESKGSIEEGVLNCEQSTLNTRFRLMEEGREG